MAQRDRRNNCCARYRELIARHCLLVGGKRHGNYLTVCYLLVKLAYLANAVGQLFLLEYVLGFQYTMYGFRAATNIARGHEWNVGESFPRVTLCAFQVFVISFKQVLSNHVLLDIIQSIVAAAFTFPNRKQGDHHNGDQAVRRPHMMC